MHAVLKSRCSSGPFLIAHQQSARRAAGISQEAAGEALGVSRGLISLIELGRGGSPSMRERYRAWVEDGFPIPAD